MRSGLGNLVSRFRLTPAAQDDLSRIWDYTAETWSPLQADAYMRGLERVFGALVAHPELMRERAEFDPPVRLRPYRSHLIVYRIEGDSLVVIRVLHARRNWNSLLQD